VATVDSRLAQARPDRKTLLRWGLVLNTELLLVLAYTVFGDSEPLSIFALRLWVYPWVWINVAGWAILRTTPAETTPRTRYAALALAVGYVAVLASVGGLVGHSHHGGSGGLRVVWTTVPPGWSPTLTYAGEILSLTLVPYRLVGYLALAYLVYATILDAASSAVTGVLGLLSCVSCSWPVLASLVAGAGGSGVAAAVTAGSYGLSTVVFVVTVALLYYRPFGGE